MFTGLFAWIRNLAYFMVLSSVFLHVVPGKTYQKYIRFFTGLLLVILLISPLLRLAGMRDAFRSVYEGSGYQEIIEQMEKVGTQLYQDNRQETQTGNYLTEEESESKKIQVEEVRIGQE